MHHLADFIRDNTAEIIGEWETFAQSLPPAGAMTRDALRDHVRGILSFIAKDIRTSQSESEQKKKSQGEDVKDASAPDTAAEIHGTLRLESGFDIMQMVSEYRALRASVTKLWTKGSTGVNERQLSELIRFNEAIDQALSESVLSFTARLDTSKDLFLGILAHDVSNPLGAIMMSAQLVKAKGPLNDQQIVLTAQIERSADRINEIVTALLDLTRARLGGGIPIKKQAMNFGVVTQKIVGEMQVLHPTRNIVAKVTGKLEGEGDPERIEQVLSNLLGNAIQYSQKDTSITIAVQGEAKNIGVSVHNVGVPIPAAALTTIFDSLRRGPLTDMDQSSGSTNLGLGLYIAKMIVLAHGGDLSVVSNKTEGTTFTAHFPR